MYIDTIYLGSTAKKSQPKRCNTCVTPLLAVLVTLTLLMAAGHKSPTGAGPTQNTGADNDISCAERRTKTQDVVVMHIPSINSHGRANQRLASRPDRGSWTSAWSCRIR